MENLIDSLNDKQKEAVLATEGPCLVIAGAGSGKTKVLTHKIAYLMAEKYIKPWNILAITFTNKAANEMKERVQKLVGDAANDMWIGTFHSICVRMLRKFIDRIGFDTSFIIFDTSDQKTVVKECLKELKIDDKLFSDKSVMYEISNAKNDMLEPVEYAKTPMTFMWLAFLITRAVSGRILKCSSNLGLIQIIHMLFPEGKIQNTQPSKIFRFLLYNVFR